MKHHAKQTSVALAVLLQFAPMARQVVTQIAEFTPNIAIIFRWGVGLSALLGGVEAVSGASAVIASAKTATGTNGVPFSFRLTTGPQTASSYTAAPLPPGLTLASGTGRITGTPTQVGVTVATVKGCDGGNGCTPAATLTITIIAGSGGGTAPSITAQPASLTVTAGNSATFSVTATGTAPLSYQWRFNGANISGATGSSYTIASAQAANAGTYSVVVSNSSGTTTSANATLTVNAAPVAPSITTQPSSKTVTAGTSASFSVTVTGTATLFYQWRFNGVNIAGATASSYTIASAQAANAGAYSVLVSNSVGSVTSADATLTVNPAPIAPSITTPPVALTVTAGNSASFSVVAAGTAPLSYHWKFNGANIAGATASSYTIASAQPANAGNYSVLVSNVAGSVTSASAALTVSVAPVAPTITSQPTSQSVTVGANVNFSASASGTGTLFYQWRFNGGDIAGATGATLSRSNVQAGDAGAYSVLVSNAVGATLSSVATLTVNPAPVAPAITSPPASQTVATGASATFSVTATGTGPLSYRWRFNGATIAGATASSYTLNNAQASNAGAYSVVVSNAAGTVTSTDATLTVTPPPPVAPSIVTPPSSQTVPVGSGATFTVVATGTAPMTYQWRFNGSAIAGATGSSVTIPNVQNSNAGSYDVVVSNSAGTVTSASATLTIGDATPLGGTYSGLFYETNSATIASSGFLTVTVTDTGVYRALLQTSDEKILFTGQFNDARRASATRLGKRGLSVALRLGPAGDENFTGTVSSDQWQATLLGDKNVFDPATLPAPYAGSYEMVVNDGTPDDRTTSSESNQGHSHGNVAVFSDGSVVFRGNFLNRLRVKQTAAISRTGNWPFFAKLPHHRGVVIGWINFADPAGPTATGTLLWLSPTDTTEWPVVVRPASND